MIRVGINGFGRIGRNFFRAAWENEKVQVVAINDIADPKVLAHLLRHDTIYGKFKESVVVEDGTFIVGDERIKVFSFRDPSEIPWGEVGVDVVLESVGIFRRRADCEKHLEAGAKRVVLSAPAKDEIDATVVIGVNDHILRPDMRIISNASCTTNCLAPMVKVIHENFGIVKGNMTTVHAYTNDQRILDLAHSDLRRAREAPGNVIPTSTGAAKAIGLVYPPLAGKMNGMALRVPVPDVSVCDVVVLLEKDVTREEVNEALKAASEGELKGIMDYTEEELVSSDIIGDPHSCIIDSPLTMVVDGNLLKVIGWYDNEWAYSCRCVDLAEKLVSLGQS